MLNSRLDGLGRWVGCGVMLSQWTCGYARVYVLVPVVYCVRFVRCVLLMLKSGGAEELRMMILTQWKGGVLA
jgi:hypothetical protein